MLKRNYKWVIALLCFLTVFAGLGFCSSAKGIYTAAITEAIGCSRSAFSINDSMRYITTTILNVFFGALVYRFGVKKLISAGILCLALSSLLYAVATTLTMFYIAGAVLGVGVAWTTTSMMGFVVNRWFIRNKGTIIGIILASNGFGAALCVKITTPIVYGSTFGYKKAYYIITAILLVVSVIVILFFKEKPEHCSDETNLNDTEVTHKWDGYKYETLLKMPSFYIVIGCIFIIMLVNVGAIVQPHLIDIGLDPNFVSTAFGIQLIVLAVFKMFIGFVYDKLGIKTAVNICLVCAIVSKTTLFFIDASPIGKVLTVAYSIIVSLSGPIETVLLPILALDLFGNKSFDKTVGIITAVSTAGHALGAPLLNIAYDVCKSYELSFVISLIASVIVLVVMNAAFIITNKQKQTAVTL